MITLYHFWSCPLSQRIRLALSYKGVNYQDCPLDYWDDETFFELGIQRITPALEIDDRIFTNSIEILREADNLFPQGESLVHEKIHDEAWQALVDWRSNVDTVLQRLYAPVLPAYADIGQDENALKDYKQGIQQKYGISVESLANDRYDAYAELEAKSQLKALAKHLAKNRFYMGQISIADLLITADLFPLQILDGINMPIDLLYYLKRVEDTCKLDLREGLLVSID